MTDNDPTLEALEAAQQRYQAERAKRVRDDGVAQYNELKGDFADFDKDPFVKEPLVRDAIAKDVEVAIVGAGFAGMLCAINLKAAGIEDFHLIDRAGDFGGTWYWNRYPGCMCDVESYTYLPLLEETGYVPTERYTSAHEIFGYCQLLGRHYDLYPHALFQTQIAEVVWDEESARWQVTTDRGDQLNARYLVTAGGILHKAKLPGIAGITKYKGDAFHTSRWNYDVTGGAPGVPMDRLGDKRVAIIGTGATAVQAVPQLARAAKELFVFQRTPSPVGERNNGPTDVEWYKSLPEGWHADRVKNFTHAVTGVKPDRDLVKDGWTHVMWDDTQSKPSSSQEAQELELSDFRTMQEIRDRIDTIVEDPETADKLKPWYGKHCKRVCFHDDYLPAFNNDHVTLVDTDGQGVTEITENGIVANGVEYPVDVIVFASGFEVTTDLDQRLGFNPIGRDGVTMKDRWHDGAHTMHGILTADFPNLFMISLVQAGFGTNFLHFLSESARHVAWLISECVEDGVRTIETTTEAEDEWLATLYGEAMKIARYSQTCTPGYYNSEQDAATASRNITYTGSLLDYVGYLDRWREDPDRPGVIVIKD